MIGVPDHSVLVLKPIYKHLKVPYALVLLKVLQAVQLYGYNTAVVLKYNVPTSRYSCSAFIIYIKFSTIDSSII